MIKIIIFSDLDGSLLNHGDYSYEEAGPALERIKRLGIPLVMTTSKTRGEVEFFQKRMGLEGPFIVENGGGIYFPAGCKGKGKLIQAPDNPVILGKPYREIRAFFESVKDRVGIVGFGDLSVREIAELADLPLEMAELAKEREFTEPFIVRDEGSLPLLEALSFREGVKLVKGGRFHHLIGACQDKGEAVKIVLNIFRSDNEGKAVTAVGIGDSQNDLPMLEQVDIPVLIPHPDMTYEGVELPNLVRASHPGSKGWNEVVERLLNDFEGKDQ